MIPTDALLQNLSLGPYRLTRKLGAGGFAPVWLADELHDGKKLREVAVKLFLAPTSEGYDADAAALVRDQIIEEARALSRVEHPTIVRFYSLQQDAATGLIGLVMEYIPGRTITERMAAEGPLDEKATLDIAISVAWALVAVHEAGLVHRDIKPANVVESVSGYRLIDFGIAKAQPDTPQQSAQPFEHRQPMNSAVTDDSRPIQSSTKPAALPEKIVGTPGYIAPEYLTGRSPATAGSDLYALGAMIFKMLTNKVPALAAATADRNAPVRMSPKVMMGIEPSPRLDAVLQCPVSPGLVELTALLLNAAPNERPRHADWVARELESIRAQRAPNVVAPRASAPGKWVDVQPLDQPGKRTVAQTFDAQPRFVGRNEGRRAIERAATDARAGGVGFVVVSGALGMGRTRLLDVAVEEQRQFFPLVLRLQASPERRGPLRPWVRAIEQLRDHPSFSTLQPLRSAIESALAPQPFGTPNDLEQALEGVENALLSLSRTVPLLIAFDDLQWSDAHSLTLLTLLLERAGASSSAHLLVLAAVRSEPNAPAHLKAFLRRIRLAQGPQRVLLEALSQEEATELAEALCPMTRDLRRALLRVSGRVPFFMVHALRAWHERGAVVLDTGPQGDVVARLRDEQVLTEDVPGVGEFVEARLGGLFDSTSAEEGVALRILSAIALYGGGLSFDVLGAATKIEEGVLETVLETLLGASILRVDGERQEYSFAQEMVRQALLNSTRRKPWFARLFRALLDVIAAGPREAQDAAFLARGYDKLGLRDAARTWLSRAMEEASAAALFDDAVEFGDRLIATSGSPAEQFDIELKILMVLVHGRRFEYARQRVESLEQRKEQMLRMPNGPQLDVRRRICELYVMRGLQWRGRIDESIVQDADALGDPLLACEARMAAAGVAKAPEAMVLATEAVDLVAGQNEALEFAARQLRAEIHLIASTPDFALCREDLSRTLAIALAHGSVWKRLDTEINLAYVTAETGHLEESIALYRRVAQFAEEHGMVGQLRMAMQNLSAVFLRAHRIPEALEAIETTIRLSKEHGDPDLWATSLSLRADALRRLDRLNEALEAASEAIDMQRSGSVRGASVTLLRRAEILEALGRVEEGLHDAREAQRIAQQYGLRDLELGALVWERWQLARIGKFASADLKETLDQVKNANVKYRPISARFIAQAERWFEGYLREEPTAKQ